MPRVGRLRLQEGGFSGSSDGWRNMSRRFVSAFGGRGGKEEERVVQTWSSSSYLKYVPMACSAHTNYVNGTCIARRDWPILCANLRHILVRCGEDSRITTGGGGPFRFADSLRPPADIVPPSEVLFFHRSLSAHTPSHHVQDTNRYPLTLFHPTVMMSVHILGLGSIGLLSSLLLRRTFRSLGIRFLPRPLTPAPTAYTIHDAKGQAQAIDLVNDANGTNPIECLIITTKAHQTRAALKPYITRLSATTLVTFIQNGMGVVDSVRDILPSQRIVLGTTTHAVYRSHTDQFHWVFDGDTFLAPHGTTFLAPQETEILSSIGQLIAFPLLEQLLYRKLALNACINPVTAIYKVRNAEVAREGNPPHELAMRLANEIHVIYSNLHPDIDVSRLAEDVTRLATNTASNTSSMLADIINGKTTEIDFINGYIVKMGQSAGMDVSQNEMVVQKVKDSKDRRLQT